MAVMVRNASIQGDVRALAVSIAGRSTNPTIIIHAVHDFIQSHVIFQREPEEILQDPVGMAEAIQAGATVYGDCDDQAMLTATLLRGLGLRSMFVVYPGTRADENHVVVYSHGLIIDPTHREEYDPTGQTPLAILDIEDY